MPRRPTPAEEISQGGINVLRLLVVLQSWKPRPAIPCVLAAKRRASDRNDWEASTCCSGGTVCQSSENADWMLWGGFVTLAQFADRFLLIVPGLKLGQRSPWIGGFR